jgi:type III secretory pathway component EscS
LHRTYPATAANASSALSWIGAEKPGITGGRTIGEPMGEPSDPDGNATPRFSLVLGDALFRLQQSVGLIPRGRGFGIGRRVLLLVLITWVPIIAWAFLTGRALRGVVAEPLFEHFGVHVRCLVAIPLLVIADATTHATSARMFAYFVTSGLVGASTRARFDGVLRDVTQLRNRSLPWVIMLVLIVVTTVWRPWTADLHELRWATEGEVAPHLTAGFGGWWFLTVVRPVFAALLLSWLWRLVILWVLLWRLARLDLSIVPTHPDHVGGLGFLEKLPIAFAPSCSPSPRSRRRGGRTTSCTTT